MSTATVTVPFERRGRESRPGLARLTGVELRKMTDTRAGFWLQVSVVALTVAAVVLLLLVGEAPDHTFQEVLSLAVAPAGVLLPIVGILLVSSEWTQRTAMTTFTLIPHRSRVIAAKLLASVALSLAALAVCVAVSALATAIAAPDVEGAWSLSAGILGQNALYLATGMITGVAFGALLLASAPAIVLYFALPLAWSAVGSLSALADAARWLDGSRTMDTITEQLLSGAEWARVGTTLAVWMLLPLLAGLWRITRGEVR